MEFSLFLSWKELLAAVSMLVGLVGLVNGFFWLVEEAFKKDEISTQELELNRMYFELKAQEYRK